MVDKSFVVNDQLIMQQARNYNSWLYELIKPYLFGKSLEIGGGIGNMTQLIFSNPQVQKHVVIDIDINCLSLQQESLLKLSSNVASKVEFIHGDFNEVDFAQQLFDVVICFNVLEHIDNDQKAMKRMYELLNPGGTLILFVPAFEFLYGEIDKKLQHFRRYNKNRMSYLLSNTGFREIKMRYFNLIGFIGWFINFVVLNRKSQNYKQVIVFDKYILPIQSFLEKFTPWQPVGQNLFAVAEK